jgi:hypothetical protein
MPKHEVALEVTVQITTTDEGEAGIDRYVDLPIDNDLQTTPFMTKEDVLSILARQCVYGRTNANQDGWADLDPESISSTVINIQDAI